MVTSSFIIGLFGFFGLLFVGYFLFLKLTIQVTEQNEAFILKFGKIEKRIQKPGLNFYPWQILPWYDVVQISKQIDFRTYKEIQVTDRFGTTVIVDLWMEFRIIDPFKTLFGVENWEDSLQGVVVHAVGSILSAKTFDEILKNRTELSNQLQKYISFETDKWGISLLGAMIQNINLLPHISKKVLNSAVANIDQTKALIEEEGRLSVASLEAETSSKIAELNGIAKSQRQLEIGKFYKTLESEPLVLQKFKKYWELSNLEPRKTVSFIGFENSKLNVADSVEMMKSFETATHTILEQ